MNRLKLLLAGLLCTATAARVPADHAQAVHFVGAGSSAMFQGFIVAAANDMATPLAIPIARFHHWSVKTGGCGGQCATINDNRTASIPNEAANLWVVWATDAGGAATDIWAYASVDSTCGVRPFLAGAQLVLGAGIGAGAPANVASPGLLAWGAPLNGAAGTCPSGFGGNTCDDTALAADVITALGGSGAGATGITITAGMTDIRPEDAKYATLRALGTTVDTSATGVGCVAATCRSWSSGYGPGPAG